MGTTAADVLIQTLIDWGVEVVFGLPGDGINGIMESLRTHEEKVRFIQVRHEESAAFMACGYAKYTGPQCPGIREARGPAGGRRSAPGGRDFECGRESRNSCRARRAGRDG